MSGIIRDITDPKRAEMQLRDSEERYRATFEQAAMGILHTSFEGRILRCNERFAEIIGYPMDEISGINFQQITPPEHLADCLAVLEDMKSGKIETANWEKRYIRKDGSLTWVKMTVSIQRDGEGTHRRKPEMPQARTHRKHAGREFRGDHRQDDRT